MSQPANDEFSQHLSDDEASNHEDASNTGAAPKQQQQKIPQTTAISNIKLPILKKSKSEWKLQEENFQLEKEGVIRRTSTMILLYKIQAVEKKRKTKNILSYAIPKEPPHIIRFHGMDDAKEIGNANELGPTSSIRANAVISNVNTIRSRQPEHPLKNMVDRGIFDSGCSGHMTGNKDQLEDFEEFNGGSVTFGGRKGYISGNRKIRVGNLDFDSVSFVKELGHFNLFSISQICDKQHKVLFTETECLVVSSDFKMPDENQILLKVPRPHNMYRGLPYGIEG
ncbi:hypothetical protein Tco_1048003 [Tanacetum coccineum]